MMPLSLFYKGDGSGLLHETLASLYLNNTSHDGVQNMLLPNMVPWPIAHFKLKDFEKMAEAVRSL